MRDRIRSFLESVQNSANKVNKTIEDIHIVCASKTRSVDELKEFINEYQAVYFELFGVKNKQIIFGENKEQEFLTKYSSIDVDWHFIGQLQSNKVKYIYDKVKLIHSLDRMSLAQEINKFGQKINQRIPALIEINIGNELSKGGVTLDKIGSFIESISQYEYIVPSGIMTIMPNGYTEDYLFKQVEEVYNRYKDKERGESWNFLSMGMTNDYQTAIENGSNMIRCGRILFGERVYLK